MKTYKEIYDELPTGWDEIKLKDYLKVLDVPIDEDGDTAELDNMIIMISVLTDTPAEDIEELSYNEVSKLINKISFISELPDVKGSLPVKDIDTISYNGFVTLQSYLKEPENILHNLHIILPEFLDVKIKSEEVLNLPILQVYSAFNEVKKKLKRYLNKTKTSLVKQAIKQTVKEKYNQLVYKLKSKKG